MPGEVPSRSMPTGAVDFSMNSVKHGCIMIFSYKTVTKRFGTQKENMVWDQLVVISEDRRFAPSSNSEISVSMHQEE